MDIPKDQVESGDGMRCWVHATFYAATKGEVIEKARIYCEQYNPMGYDTHTIVPPMSSDADGYWKTKLRRYSTCE